METSGSSNEVNLSFCGAWKNSLEPRRFGRIDALINNAGFSLFGVFEAISREKIQEFSHRGSTLRVVLPSDKTARLRTRKFAIRHSPLPAVSMSSRPMLLPTGHKSSDRLLPSKLTRSFVHTRKPNGARCRRQEFVRLFFRPAI
jgi:hypothetical protein